MKGFRLPYNAVKVEIRDGLFLFIDANGTITYQKPACRPRTYVCSACHMTECKQVCLGEPTRPYYNFGSCFPQWEDVTKETDGEHYE